ncbi:MAG: tetratricopeptide repeat protein [Acidobacteria bacterium]|nr:tetratricopeptide repeat protein [Acidobacteriota bacterium]
MRPALLLLLAALPVLATDPESCRPCHVELVERYLATPMGRSFFLPSADEEIGDFSGSSYYHEASDRHYEMFRRGETLLVRRYRLDEQGRRTDILERPVTHVMGSGERARSYLFQSSQGRLYELPVSWYSQEQAWAMAPGYDRANQPGFTRQVNHKCMFCHNGYPDVAPERSRPGWDADVIFPKQLPLGIDCDRCHGDGAEHARSGRPEAIVNPARLSPERSLEVCMQCHLESTTFRLPETLRRFGRSFYSYRPGEPLGDSIVHFDHAPGTGHDDKFEIVSAAYRLLQSRCFRQSEAMTCLDCHNPHDRPEPSARAARYRARCLDCHALTLAAEHAAQDDCVACHMPLRRTEDVVHVAMTDHKIQRLPPPGDLLAPRREKTEAEQVYRGPVVQLYPPPGEDSDALAGVYLALAQVKERADLAEGLPRLEQLLAAGAAAAPEPWFELAEKLAETGRAAEAEKAYRRAVEIDPSFPQAWNNLGNLLADGGRLQEALQAYDQAIAVAPLDPAFHGNRGLALLDAGRPAEALEAFDAAVRANPADAEAQARQGAALLSMGRLAEAEGALRTALALEPSHRQARHNLALLEQALRQPQTPR